MTLHETQFGELRYRKQRKLQQLYISNTLSIPYFPQLAPAMYRLLRTDLPGERQNAH